jgi:hypothetical protein
MNLGRKFATPILTEQLWIKSMNWLTKLEYHVLNHIYMMVVQENVSSSSNSRSYLHVETWTHGWR